MKLLTISRLIHGCNDIEKTSIIQLTKLIRPPQVLYKNLHIHHKINVKSYLFFEYSWSSSKQFYNEFNHKLIYDYSEYSRPH